MLMGLQLIIPRGIPCLGSLLGLVALGLMITGVVVIFVKRSQLHPKMQLGAKVSLVGLICMGIIFVIIMIIMAAMVFAIIEAAIEMRGSQPEIMIPLVGDVKELALQKQVALDTIEAIKKEKRLGIKG